MKLNFFHAWKCIISGVKYRSKFWHLRRKLAVIFLKWLFFENSLVISWATWPVKMQVKEKNIFWTFRLIENRKVNCDFFGPQSLLNLVRHYWQVEENVLGITVHFDISLFWHSICNCTNYTKKIIKFNSFSKFLFSVSYFYLYFR